MGVEFQFGKMKEVLEIGCRTGMHSMSLNCTLLNGKCYVIYILPQFLKIAILIGKTK